MRKRAIILILMFAVFNTVYPQYAFLYRQYALNGLGLNPAYTGSREVFTVSALYRNQWAGIDGAPTTYTLSADAPLKKNKIALGLYLITEEIGNTRNTNAEFNYAYRITLRKGKLSLGLKGSVNTFSTNIARTNLPDVVFENSSDSYFMPNFGFGAYYYIYNRFFAGVSVPFLFNYRTASANNGYEVYHDIKNYNYLFTSGVLLSPSENFNVRLSGLAAYNQIAGTDFDVNGMMIWFNKVWTGASYYSPGILTFLLQFQVNPQLKIGYSYDHNMGVLNRLSGSHELMLKYEFSYIIDAYNPRYF